MQYCTITITTTVDEKQTTAKRHGNMQLSATSAVLVYREESAQVSISLFPEYGEIVRVGDYTLKLPLKTGEVLQGKIGIGDSHGAVEVDTHKIAFSTSENSLLAQLQYTLIFGKERQVMRLRIHAKADKGRITNEN